MFHKFLRAGCLALGICVVTGVPARSEDLNDRIKSVEQELAALKAQQAELKKEATAAADALPSFSYRPGNGLLIEAADKGWALRTGI